MLHKQKKQFVSDETLNKITINSKIKLQIEERRNGLVIIKCYPTERKPFKVLIAKFEKTKDNRYLRTYSDRGFKNTIFNNVEDIKTWYCIE